MTNILELLEKLPSTLPIGKHKWFSRTDMSRREKKKQK
jgi:hypothetical protein